MMMNPYLAWEAGKGMFHGGKKGKGKGKGGDAPKGKGKGKAGDNDEKVPPPPKKVYQREPGTDEPCKCCGKARHSKKQCWHREKACNFCGKIGHVEAMCRDKASNGDDIVKDKDADKAKLKKEWLCTYCHDFNPDENVLKCGLKVGCLGRSPKCQWQVGAKPVNASPMSKNTQKLMEEGDPVKLQEEVDSISRKVSVLDQDIAKYEAVDWKATSQCSTKHFKDQKDELLTQQRTLQSKLDDNMPLLRSIVGDQTRLINNHQQRMTKLNESLEAAKQRKEEGQLKAKERLQQEKERHLQEMARIEELSETAKKQIEEDIKKLTEKIEEEEQEYKKKRSEVGTELAKQAGPGASEANVAPMQTDPAHAVITSDVLTEEVVASHLATDQTLQGMNVNQARALMTSMFDLFNKLAQRKTQQQPQDQMQLDQQQQQQQLYQQHLQQQAVFQQNQQWQLQPHRQCSSHRQQLHRIRSSTN